MGTGGSQSNAGRPAQPVKAEHCRSIDVRCWHCDGELRLEWPPNAPRAHSKPVRAIAMAIALLSPGRSLDDEPMPQRLSPQ